MKPEVWIPLLLIICCGAIPLIALGGVGILEGIVGGQWLLILAGLIILILGVSFYFRRGK